MAGIDQYTKSLLHFDGNLKDEISGKIWGLCFDSGIKKFGDSSLFFNGASSLCAIADNNEIINFGTNAFSIDWWEYRLDTSDGCPVFCIESSAIDTASVAASIVLGWHESGILNLFSSTDGNNWNLLAYKSFGTAQSGHWVHRALCRAGNTWYLFENGNIITTASASGSLYYNSAYKLILGGRNKKYFYGYIDEVRISNIARWTAAFTPETAAYSMDSNTILLLHFDNSLIDEAGNFSFDVGSISYSETTAKFSKSLYLDGTQYFSRQVASGFSFGTDDFTIDWWEYRSNTNYGHPIYALGRRPVDTSGVSSGIMLGWTQSGHPCIHLSSNGSSWGVDGQTIGDSISGQWVHREIDRSGNNFYCFQNGILVASFSSSISIYCEDDYFHKLGIHYSSGDYYEGYIDEFRISIGNARHTGAFTPPTSAYGPDNTVESGHTDLRRNLSTDQINHADMRLNAVLQYLGNTDSLRNINKNEYNPADMYREVKKAQFSDVDTKRNVYNTENKNADTKRTVYNTEIGSVDIKRTVYNTEIGNADIKRIVLYEAIAESGYSDIMRKILKAQKVNTDMHCGIESIYSGHADILSNKVILVANFSDIRKIILASENPASDMLRTIYARENGNIDTRRIIMQGVISETAHADIIYKIFRAENAPVDSIRNIQNSQRNHSDIFLQILNAQKTHTDLLLQTLIVYAGHTDILRDIVWGENGHSDLRRIVPYSVDIDGNSLAYQGYGIHLREKIFSDAFDIVTPRSDISTDNQISGKVGDFNFSFLVESTRRLGAGLTSISGRYNQDYIFFTAYYVNSVGNALMSAGPFGYNRILDLPVKAYFHSFRYGPTITGMLTFADIMNQLYGWTTRIPTQQINVFIRSDALYIVQRGYEPNTIDLTNTAHTLPEVSTELMRLTWNYDSENNKGGVQTIDQTPDPFTGSITFGDSVNSYVGGLLMTETRDSESTEYSYTSYDGKNMYPSQKVITNSKDNTVTTTKYSYLPTNDAADIYLYEEEETQVKTLSGGGTTTTVRKTIHTPIAGGWYGHKLYVDDKLQSTTMTQGKPGQKVSLYSINEANKSLDSTQSKTKNATRPNWYLIRANGFPFAKSDTSDINRINQAYALLNRSTKEEIAFDVYGLTHIVDFTDLILYEGNEYHLVSNDILKTPTELKQHIVFNRYVKNGVTL